MHGMMQDKTLNRGFHAVSIRGCEGGPVKLHAGIECSKCGAHFEVPAKNGSKVMPMQVLAKRFRSAGWAVGGKPRNDVCPDCQRKPEINSKKEEDTMSNVQPIPLKADEPRKMQREDRRIIFAKIDEVYGDSAYIPPWTDAAVAKNLGVPLAWVRDVREENFGDEGTNPEVIEFLDKVDKAVAILSEERNKLLEAGKKVARMIEDLKREASRIEQSIKMGARK